MSNPIPTIEPADLVAGDTWAWSRSFADYPASAWTLTYYMVGPAGNFQIVASANGAAFAIAVAAATTAAYMPGVYTWAAYVSAGAERYQVADGRLTIRQDFAKAGAGYDGRTYAERALDNIEAVIEARATKDQESYSIDGRSLSRTPLDQLLAFRDRFRAEVAIERRRARAAKGLAHSGQVLVGFGRR